MQNIGMNYKKILSEIYKISNNIIMNKNQNLREGYEKIRRFR